MNKSASFTESSQLGRLAIILKNAREKSGFTQQGIVEKLKERGVNLSKRAYVGYELGENPPKLLTFLALADLLGIWQELATTGMQFADEAASLNNYLALKDDTDQAGHPSPSDRKVVEMELVDIDVEGMDFDQVKSGHAAVRRNGEIVYYLKYWFQKLAKEKVEGEERE